MPTQVARLPLRQLSSSVDQAVKAALARHPVKQTGGFVFNPGILAGPILDAATDLKVAQQIADEVTQGVQKAQAAAPGASALSLPPLTSGVLVTHNHIICGFFPYPTPILSIEE